MQMLRRQGRRQRRRLSKRLDNFRNFIISLIISLFISKLYNFDPYNNKCKSFLICNLYIFVYLYTIHIVNWEDGIRYSVNK